MSNSHWMQVCSRQDLIDNSGVAALCNGVQLAIYYIPGTTRELYALDNHDPFSKANVLSRGIVGDLKGKLVVASPIYKQHFDLETGVSLEDDSVKVGVWPVKMVDDQVMVNLSKSA